MTISIWWALAVFAAFLGALSIYKTGRLLAAFYLVVAVIFLCCAIIQKRRLQKIATQRQEDSICTFARSFGRRAVDTRIIRATYEELQKYFSSDVQNFPIRATDSVEKDLRLDEEDLEDVAMEIARRAQRSFENIEKNPLFGKVKTVGDLVLFLNLQPLQR
jgi:hypothetical protein